jgi:hypothetical protein
MAGMELRHFSPAELGRYRAEADATVLPLARQAARLFQTLGVTATTNDWLLRQEWKRALAVPVFRDLLRDGPRLRVLEVGGGLSALTLELARRHDYTLIELATHENEACYRKVEAHLGRPFVRVADWHDLPAAPQDVVIANDLFPNVDQRLYEFVDRYFPQAGELRLTLTYYENTAWQVRRVSSGEALTVRPWGLREVAAFLEALAARDPARLGGYDRGQLVYHDYENVLFTNRRNILRLRAAGGGQGRAAA